MAAARKKPAIHTPARVRIADLKPHPRNYRSHPADQIEQIQQSIREHGFYRNIVTARDGTILAGHGVVLAAEQMGLTEVPVIRLSIGPDHPKALKLLAADNELGLRAEIDDRALSEILFEIKEQDVDGLLGTGYDDQMLANLLFISRPANEIADMDEAAQWVGMPAFESYGGTKSEFMVIIRCETQEAREELFERLGLVDGAVVKKMQNGPWSGRYPPREEDDVRSAQFNG